MIQISAQMRVLVAIEPVDGRKGIDSLVRLCQDKLSEDPFSGCVFIFRSRRGSSIRLLAYEGQGYWLAQKRLSKGRFVWWPEADTPTKGLEAYEAQLLMAAGDVRGCVPRRCGGDCMPNELKHSLLLTFQEKQIHTADRWLHSGIAAGISAVPTSFIYAG